MNTEEHCKRMRERKEEHKRVLAASHIQKFQKKPREEIIKELKPFENKK